MSINKAHGICSQLLQVCKRTVGFCCLYIKPQTHCLYVIELIHVGTQYGLPRAFARIVTAIAEYWTHFIVYVPRIYGYSKLYYLRANCLLATNFIGGTYIENCFLYALQQGWHSFVQNNRKYHGYWEIRNIESFISMYLWLVPHYYMVSGRLGCGVEFNIQREK